MADIKEHIREARRRAGRAGGLATKRKHGKKHYQSIGAKGGQADGSTTKLNHGDDYFHNLSLKMVKARKSKREALKRLAAQAAQQQGEHQDEQAKSSHD